MPETYTRRPPPETYDSAWLGTEFAKIQRVLAALGTTPPGTVTEADLSLSDVTTDDVSITKHGFAPKAPNDAAKFLNGLGLWSTVPTNGSALVRGAGLTGDRSTNAGSYISSFLNTTVLTGESWFFHWTLWIGTSVGISSGISMQITAPSVSGSQLATQHGVRSSTEISVVSDTAPLSFSPSIANGDYSAVPSWAVVEATFQNFGADGTVDLQFKNVGLGQTVILRKPSTFYAIQIG